MTTVLRKLPFCTHRYAIFVSYLGTKYRGSQRLTNREQTTGHDTVQEALEWSMESFLPKVKCRITSSSRTDRGVHALTNCFTLPLMDFKLATDKFKSNANQNLMSKNHDIIVKEVLLVPADFHPRSCAISREYIYRLAVMDKFRVPQLSSKRFSDGLNHLLPITELYRILPVARFDYQRALEAINILKGKHDFRSFSGELKENEDPIRDLEIDLVQEEPNQLNWADSSPYISYQFHFKTRSFLYNMVRRVVGCILSYATSRTIGLEDIRDMLNNPSREGWKSNMFIAEPWGLYLSKIHWDRSAFEGAIKTYGDKIEKVDYPFATTEEPTNECKFGQEKQVFCP